MSNLYFPDSEGPTHDAVCLMAVKKSVQVLGFAIASGVLDAPKDASTIQEYDPDYEEWPDRVDPEAPVWCFQEIEPRRVSVELEWEIKGASIHGGDWFVDVCILVANRPKLLLEIKSKRETQSASGWSRQIRGYRKATDLPCMLVVAHDLRDEHREYLSLVGVTVCDLRTLP